MYFVIDMPLNENGDGPETDPEKVHKVVYEVWDTDFLSVGSFDTEQEAEVYCEKLIEEWMTT